MAAVLLIGGLADTTIKYLFYWLVSEQFLPDPSQGRTLYFATFYVWLNGASLMVQAFATGRLIRSLGLVFALLSLPVALFLGAAFLAVNTLLIVMYAIRIIEATLQTSLYEPGIGRLFIFNFADELRRIALVKERR